MNLYLSYFLLAVPVIYAAQTPLSVDDDDQHHHFTHPIRRVAVIGAGPSGLQAAATLVEDGFEVRLYERAPHPGGNWFVRDQTPVHASFPNRPLVNSSYIPDIPSHELPYSRIFHDGDEGLNNDWRLREHESPSPVWRSLTAIAPSFVMELPNVKYAPDTPWKPHNRFIQRLVRQYAASTGLNSNDDESLNITSYSTRVERAHKDTKSNKWTLTLRKLVPLSVVSQHSKNVPKLHVEYWNEEFDAVVVATSALEAPWVPSSDITSLDECAKVFPERIYHSREYRKPEKYAGKHVLIVGGSNSAIGIAADLLNVAASVTLSVRERPGVVRKRAPGNSTVIPEISQFRGCPSTRSSDESNLKDVEILLVNETRIAGYDHIILATGFRRSVPFLVDHHNSSIVGYSEPETKVAPIVTDGTHLRSLHWTGHYIADPTLAFLSLIPWTMGRYQALGISHVWSGHARLPSIAKMWEAYPGAGKELKAPHAQEELYARLYTTWLNSESLVFGGRLAPPLPTWYRENIIYFTAKEWGLNLSEETFANLENLPRSEWPARNSVSASQEDEVKAWAGWNDSW